MIRVRYLMILVFTVVLVVSMVSFPCFGQNQGKVEKEGYIGSEACQGCHSDLYEAFKKNPHWGKECESCHGLDRSTQRPKEKGLSLLSKVRRPAFKPMCASHAMRN